jgi:hypothetical protein
MESLHIGGFGGALDNLRKWSGAKAHDNGAQVEALIAHGEIVAIVARRTERLNFWLIALTIAIAILTLVLVVLTLILVLK